MGLDKSLNQSLQGNLEKIGYMSSNGLLGNCYKVLNKYLIGHVLGEQNGGSTNTLCALVDLALVSREYKIPSQIGRSTEASLRNL